MVRRSRSAQRRHRARHRPLVGPGPQDHAQSAGPGFRLPVGRSPHRHAARRPTTLPGRLRAGRSPAAQGQEEKEDVTVTRISPLKNSAIISVASSRIAENWSSMARQEGASVPYSKEEYSAIMKGMFSIDLFQIGTFATYNKTGFKNLTEKAKKEAFEKGITEIDDPYVKTKDGASQKLIQLPKSIRQKRVLDVLAALKTISGGAMQTNNMTDVTPKFIVLATMASGNHPFSHIVKSDGISNEKVLLNIEGLKEVLNDYKEQFQGIIFIGKRSGFLDEYDVELKALEKEFSNVKVLTINQAIDQYCDQVIIQMP